MNIKDGWHALPRVLALLDIPQLDRDDFFLFSWTKGGFC